MADAAGNQSPAGTPYVVTIDISAPAVTAQVLSVIDDVGLIRGAVTRGGRTDDGQLQLTGSLSAALAPGESVQVFDGATWLGVASLTGSGLTWSFRTEWLSDASHAFTARVADAAGNLSASGTAFGVTVDSRAPTTLAHVSVAADNVGVIQGAVASGGVNDDTTLTLAGTVSGALASGESVRIFDGASPERFPAVVSATTPHPGWGGALSAPLKADETVRVYDGARFLGLASVDGSSWSFSSAPLAAGSHVFTARVADAAGNQSPAAAPYVVLIDSVPPTTTAQVTAVNDDLGLIRGSVPRGGRTDDPALQLSGSLSASLAPGESVRVYDGSTLLGVAQVVDSSWSLLTPTLANGSHSFTARVVDQAGNQSVAGTAYGVTVTPELRITALNPDQREGNSGSTPFRFQVDRSGNAWNPGTGTAELINAPLLNVEPFVGSNLGVVYQP